MLKTIATRLFFGCLLLALPVTGLTDPLVLFDLGHGQRFTPAGDGPLDLSQLAGIFREQHIELKNHRGPLTDASLQQVSALIIAGSFAPFSVEETAVVRRFVDGGGSLAVMLHIAPPLSPLLATFGVAPSRGVVREQDDIIADDPLNFRVNHLFEHPLFADLQSFDLYAGWALLNRDGRSQIIAATGPKAWIDLNADGIPSQGDVMQACGMVVAGRSGAGRFVVFGDDAIFQNRFLSENNRLLAVNLAHWLTMPNPVVHRPD